MGILDGLRRIFNVFDRNSSANEFALGSPSMGPIMTYMNAPSRSRRFIQSERSIIASIYNRIAVDCSVVDIFHIKKSKDGQYEANVKSGLQECLTIAANIDQEATEFKRDAYLSLLEQGSIAIVAVETSNDPNETGSYEVLQLRIGIITQWFPQHVEVDLYDERTGMRNTVVLPKREVAIVENPFYSIMNEPNSTYQRLVRKLNMLDAIDEQSSSGKLDIIIQLPYVIKNERRQKEAHERAQSLQTQLKDSKYGIAYTDGTEKITQLNRPAENNLLKQVELLTEMLYDQLGISKDVLSGIAEEETMMHYHERTLRPLVSAVVESLNRTFLTKTARTQGQAIESYQDPFSLVPVTKLAELADKFSRNEIMSGNEIRGVLALRPSQDPRADMLLNKNLPTPEEMVNTDTIDSNTENTDTVEVIKTLTDTHTKSNNTSLIDKIFQEEEERQNGR